MIFFAEHTNKSITQHTPSGWTSFTAISGGCSCDFYRSADSSDDDESKLIAKYQKKGWSEAKIQRVINDRSSSAVRSAGLRDDVLDLASDLTQSFGLIRLSLHWYSGDIETESFKLNDAGATSLTEFREDPTSFKDETTLIIKKGEQGGDGDAEEAA